MLQTRAAIKKLNALFTFCQQAAPVGSRPASHFLMPRSPPGAVETLSDFRLLRTTQTHVHVPPARRGGQRFLAILNNARPLIDDIHAAEIGDAVVNDQQLAMVAPVENPQHGETPKRLPE